MKILFLTHYFPPEGNAPASRTYDNCKRWVAAGHEVTVITGVPNVPGGKVYKGYRNKLYQTEVLDGIRVIRLWTFIAPNKGAVRRIINYLSFGLMGGIAVLFSKRPDVLVATSPQFFCGLGGMMAGLCRRFNRVLEIRDIWPESIEAVGAMKKSLVTRFLELLERLMYRCANQVVTVGEGYRRKLIERGVPEQQIAVITNGADLDFYQPGKADAGLQRHFGLEGRFSVAYVGTIGMAAGLNVALEAARLLKQANDDSVRILLVGDGAEREQLERVAKEEGLAEIVFTGRIEKSGVPAMLRSVDACLIHLRESELFKTVLPSKLFEAFAVAKPVILGVDGDARQILEAAQAGVYIEPGNATALIQAIKDLQSNPQKAREYGQSGYQFVRANYNRDDLALRYLELLLRTAKESKRNKE